MLCCGSSSKAEPSDGNSAVAPLSGRTVTQQPGLHRDARLQFAEKYQHPTIPSPPPQVHAHILPNGHSSPPPLSRLSHGTNSPPPTVHAQFSAFSQEGQSSYNLPFTTSYQDFLQRPSPNYPVSPTANSINYMPHSVSVAQSGRDFSPPSTDEGKMSISIDFGAWICLLCGLSPKSHGLHRYYVFWRGKYRSLPSRFSCERSDPFFRHMAPLVSLLEKCSKFCIGRVRLRLSGKSQRVFCMMSMARYSPGVWKPRVRHLYRVPLNVNGEVACVD